MRSVSSPTKLAFLAIGFAAGVFSGIAAAPLWKLSLMTFNQRTYGELTYLCDHAMREHMIAKQQVATDPGERAVAQLKASEIGLINCQDYDLMRKRLIRWGLSENDLSEMALLAIEERTASLQEVVRIHEIRY